MRVKPYDSDWQCTQCKTWHRQTTRQCRRCGRIPYIRLTRLKLREMAYDHWRKATERKYGLRD